MHITLLTATGAYNLGDELILLQEYEYLKDRYRDASFTVVTYDRASSLLPIREDIRYISYFPSSLRKKPFLNILFFCRNLFALATSDLIVIGGGGLIYDNEPGQSFSKLLTEWKIRVYIVKLFAIPVWYWSLGIHVRAENHERLRPLFTGKYIHVSVRDRASKDILDSLDIPSLLVSDPVFLYDPEMPKLLPKKRPKIGLSFRAGYLKDEMYMIEHIITFLQTNEYELILLNHSFHQSDLLANDSIFLRSLTTKYNITVTNNIWETLRTYKELEFVVGMRLHSLILAIVHAIPFLAISYSKKTDELIRSLEYEYSLQAATFDITLFKECFLELVWAKKDVWFALEWKNDTIKKEIRHTLKSAFYGLEAATIKNKDLGR